MIVVRISLLLILLMALFPPWRGWRASNLDREEFAGYSFLLLPHDVVEIPESKSTKSGKNDVWVGMHIDGGLLIAQCLIIVAVAGLVVTFRRNSPLATTAHAPLSAHATQKPSAAS